MNYGKIEDNGIIVGLPSVWKDPQGKTVTGLHNLQAEKLLQMGFFPVRDDGNLPYNTETQRKIFGEWQFDAEKKEIFRLEYIEEIPEAEIAENKNQKKTDTISEIYPEWKQRYLLAMGIETLYRYQKPTMKPEDISIMENLKGVWQQIRAMRNG